MYYTTGVWRFSISGIPRISHFVSYFIKALHFKRWISTLPFVLKLPDFHLFQTPLPCHFSKRMCMVSVQRTNSSGCVHQTDQWHMQLVHGQVWLTYTAQCWTKWYGRDVWHPRGQRKTHRNTAVSVDFTQIRFAQMWHCLCIQVQYDN